MLWASLIYYFSSLPNLHTEFGGSWDLILRKGAHASEYAILAWLLCRAAVPRPVNYRIRYLVIFLIAAGYAVTDEWHQSFVFGRTATRYDVMIDTVGALAGILLHGWFFLKSRILNK
ncbi:MAG: VanZ family protein [Patescibacteria group bacterium]